MAYFDKEFKFEREENIEEFIESLEAGPEAKKIFAFKPNQKILKDGDDYILVIVAGDYKKELKFKSGDTTDDTIAENFVVKSTFTVDGDTFTQVLDFGDKGTITIKREFQDDLITVTLSTSKSDGTATRYYVPA